MPATEGDHSQELSERSVFSKLPMYVAFDLVLTTSWPINRNTY
jgi:hypothetical protein